ncbi:MAG: type IV pilus assembly protein PilM [Verrucomicrobiales bacterium]|jgi:type IV pilus assembly protein PilM
MASKSTSTVINLGSQRVSLATIAGGSKGSLALTRYFHHDLEGDPSADATRIPQMQMGVKSVVDQAKAKGSLVRCAIAGQPVFMRFVKLPPLSEDKVDQIVEFEAQQNVPFPIDEVAWGYQLIGGAGSMDVEVLLGAVKSDELTAVNSAVERSGVKTVSVDVSPMLVYNAYRYSYPDQSKPALILDVGARTANLIYAEPGRVFISSSRIGGASFTQAIAKEMDIPFEAAEQLKLQKGTLDTAGGSDEQADLISTVLKSAVTRLHGEIVRTNNRYKSQQEGNLPEIVYLAGRASGTPYLAHFLQEKLGVPVEYFNPLRSVAIGPEVNQEAVAAEAHTMGELVGLALRNGDQSPIELELVPESLKNARDLERRKPALMLGTVGLLGAIVAGGFYFTRAAQVIDSKVKDLTEETAELQSVQTGIDRSSDDLKLIQAKAQPYTDAVVNRTYWADFLTDLNDRLKTPEVWFTKMVPMVGEGKIGKEISLDLTAALGARNLDRYKTDGGRGKRNAAPEKKVAITSVVLSGLFRSPARPTIVSEVLLSELKLSDYFNLEGVDELGDPIVLQDLIRLDDGNDDTVWAYEFELTLPLKNPVIIE